MAKKKDSVALFEVIARNREAQHEAGLNVPAWMGQGAPPAQQEAEVGQAPMPAAPRPAAPGEPIVSMGDGRVRLSLNPVSCAVIGLAMVLLLLAAFFLGRATVSTPQADQAAASGQQNAAAGTAVAMKYAADNPRVPGQYYLVIQGTQGMTGEHEQAAQDIVEYLAAEGVPAEVGDYSGHPNQKVVWSLTGFDSPNSVEALNYVAQIEKLGRAYMSGGGRYNFSQRRDGKLQPWFQRVPGQ